MPAANWSPQDRLFATVEAVKCCGDLRNSKLTKAQLQVKFRERGQQHSMLLTNTLHFSIHVHCISSSKHKTSSTSQSLYHHSVDGFFFNLADFSCDMVLLQKCTLEGELGSVLLFSSVTHKTCQRQDKQGCPSMSTLWVWSFSQACHQCPVSGTKNLGSMTLWQSNSRWVTASRPSLLVNEQHLLNQSVPDQGYQALGRRTMWHSP